MNHRIAALVFLMLTPLASRAQQEASTLEELCRRAPWIVTARLSSLDTDKVNIRAGFEPKLWWKGKREGQILITEAARAHCGTALRGLQKGREYLLFFELRGTMVRPLGGQRGIIKKTAEIEAAVKALLLIKDSAAKARLLAGQLSDKQARVREDAALALASLPGLELCTKETRTLLMTRLDGAMRVTGTGDLGSPALGSLLLANARVDARKTALRAWTLAIDENHHRRNGLGREVLLRKIGSDIMLATVPLASAKTHGSRLLLLNALDSTQSPKALPWVERLLRLRDPILKREATVTMLSLGSKPSDLSKVVGKELVLQAESLRAERLKKPRFQAIRPR